MKPAAKVLTVLTLAAAAMCQSRQRAESEYYVRAYAFHYAVPLGFVRSLIQEESGWQPCAISTRGAAGLMQLMPETAGLFGVRDRCDVRQNISAGVRYLAHLIGVFHGDLRLVAAAYQAGERRIAARGLNYSNPEVIAYVRRIRQGLQSATRSSGMGERNAEAPCQ